MERTQNPPTAVNRMSEPGLHVNTIARSGCEEHFITVTLQDGETADALFQRAAAAVRESNATIVAQDVFGIEDGQDALANAFGERSWPLTWILNLTGAKAKIGDTQLWAISGPSVEVLRADGEVIGTLWSDAQGQYCRIAGVHGDPAAPNVDQARYVFETMKSTLLANGMDFSNVVRTWLYLDKILSWYGNFNKTRDAFFRDNGIFDGLVPASTGIGAGNPRGAALVGGCFAILPKAENIGAYKVKSPLQCPAMDYGSSFSRAVEVDMGDHRRLLVSGTASIDPEGTVIHREDVRGQIARTMEVVGAILDSRGMEWADVTRAIAYFTEAEDDPAFDEYCESAGLPQMPFVHIENDICLDGLIFEIEIDAVRPS